MRNNLFPGKAKLASADGSLDSETRHRLVNRQQETAQNPESMQVRLQPNLLCPACRNYTCIGLSMPCRAILHDQKSAILLLNTYDTGQAVFKCPEPVPARAATSHNVSCECNQSLDLYYCCKLVSKYLCCLTHGEGKNEMATSVRTKARCADKRQRRFTPSRYPQMITSFRSATDVLRRKANSTLLSKLHVHRRTFASRTALRPMMELWLTGRHRQSKAST
eukprot:31511-Pleurochrysis_carterae.AAC.1